VSADAVNAERKKAARQDKTGLRFMMFFG